MKQETMTTREVMIDSVTFRDSMKPKKEKTPIKRYFQKLQPSHRGSAVLAVQIGEILLLAFIITLNYQMKAIVECLSDSFNSSTSNYSTSLAPFDTCQSTNLSESFDLKLVICPPLSKAYKKLPFLSLFIGDSELLIVRTRKEVIVFTDWLTTCRTEPHQTPLCKINVRTKNQSEDNLPDTFCHTFIKAPSPFSQVYLCQTHRSSEDSHLTISSVPLTPLETRLLQVIINRFLNEANNERGAMV